MVTTNVGAGSSGARKSKKKPRQRLNVPGRDTEGRASMQEEITPHKAKYLAYLDSPEWQEKRKAALERAGHRCQLCAGTTRLQVHHNSYANLYREAPQDLTVLCDGCHRKHHDIGERKDSPRRKAQTPRPAPLKNAHPSLPVRCPLCGAAPGAPCIRSEGQPRTRVHKYRSLAADGKPVPPASKKRSRRNGHLKVAAKKRAGWEGPMLDFLGSAPGCMTQEVVRRFQARDTVVIGRLGYLSQTGRAIQIGGGWYAVGLDGVILRDPVSPGWRPKGAIY